jgi:hypothetical protein
MLHNPRSLKRQLLRKFLKPHSAWLERKCRYCGGTLRGDKIATFIIDVIGALEHTSMRPPAHHECAQELVRRIPAAQSMLTILWSTYSYRATDNGNLFVLGPGPAISIEFWFQGRRATREEIVARIDVVMPLLRTTAKTVGGDALEALGRRYGALMRRLPHETTSTEAGDVHAGRQ